MDVRIELHQAVQVQQAFAAAPGIVLDELTRAVSSSMSYLHGEVVKGTPADLGTLRGAFIYDVTRTELLDAVFGELTNPITYALPVEMGTKPHYPPIEPLIGWVERKLDLFGDEAEARARAIQRKIGRFGNTGYGMVRYAWMDGQSTVQNEFAQAAQRIEQRLGAAAGGGAA